VGAGDFSAHEIAGCEDPRGGTACNIPGCEARNRENIEVCIAFMHQKIQRIFALLIKPIKVIEVSLVSMGIELVIDMSAINFDMTFVDFLKLRGKQFEFIIQN
jgi:hypothetical protein